MITRQKRVYCLLFMRLNDMLRRFVFHFRDEYVNSIKDKQITTNEIRRAGLLGLR